MRFYNREKELELLQEIHKRSASSAQMTFVVGRRRIGKTRLLVSAYKDIKAVYFFIAKKNEALLCAEFSEEIRQQLQIPIFGEIKSFEAIFELLMQEAKRQPMTVIIDEFQEFISVNPSTYSSMQKSWDANKEESKINLVLCGSVYSIMYRIFESAKEPLFGRATQRMHVKAFDIETVKGVLKDYAPRHTAEDLLAFYMVTGGVAKYVELLVQQNAHSKATILECIFAENSLFLDEGRNVLIEEFGKEYGNYFSILSLIASGKTSRVEMESIMEMDLGGFLNRLENEYNLVKKIRPILSKPGSRTIKYKISDNFLSFWFRFIYKHRSAVEAGNLEYLLEIVQRDYTTYSGKVLEDYFIEKIKAEKRFNLLGTYWEKRNTNEIDIVAVNDLEKKVLFAEVKRQKKNISISVLKEKSKTLQQRFKGYEFSFAGLSLEDM